MKPDPLAECLTDPSGKSFTFHLLRQTSHEGSFSLPAAISQSFYLSNCSLCSRLTVLSDRREPLSSLTCSPLRHVISTHLRLISWLPAQMLGVYLTFQRLALFGNCATPGLSLLRAQYLFDCPSQEDSSLSFI